MQDDVTTEQNQKLHQTVNIELDDMTAIFDAELGGVHKNDDQKRAGTVIEAKPSSDLLDGLCCEQDDTDDFLIKVGKLDTAMVENMPELQL